MIHQKTRRSFAALITATATAATLVSLSPAAALASPAFPPEGRAAYIVSLIQSADAKLMAGESHRRGAGSAKRFFNTAVNGYLAEMTASEAARLAADPRVTRVEADRRVTATGKPVADGSVVPSWGLDRLNQPSLPLDQSYTDSRSGLGVNVYVVDSGVSPHNEFGDRLRPGFTSVDDGRGTQDCNGHGTHVAAISAGSTFGVASAASVVPVRVLDCSASGSWSSIIAGLDWVATNGVRPAVVNVSLTGGAMDTVDDAVRRLIGSGFPVTVAAGNQGVDACTMSPARTAGALTVGASDAADRRPDWSNFGGCLDLFAPGDNITSADSATPSSIANMSGTSMAAPHVAGIAALVLQEAPWSSPADVAAAVLRSARPATVQNAISGSAALAQTNSPPAVRAVASCTVNACLFDGTASSDDLSTPIASWKFSDRVTTPGLSAIRTFTRSGSFTATLSVSDGDNVATAVVTVSCLSTGKGRAAVIACNAS